MMEADTAQLRLKFNLALFIWHSWSFLPIFERVIFPLTSMVMLPKNCKKKKKKKKIGKIFKPFAASKLQNLMKNKLNISLFI